MGVTRSLTSAGGAGRTEIRQPRGAGEKAFISRTEEARHRCHGASVGPDEYPGAVVVGSPENDPGGLGCRGECRTLKVFRRELGILGNCGAHVRSKVGSYDPGVHAMRSHRMAFDDHLLA